jgi:hypothetical protein
VEPGSPRTEDWAWGYRDLQGLTAPGPECTLFGYMAQDDEWGRIRVRSALIERLKALAEAEHRSLSNLVEMILLAALAQ